MVCPAWDNLTHAHACALRHTLLLCDVLVRTVFVLFFRTVVSPEHTVVLIVLGMMPYLDNFAHIGGLIMGFFAGLGLLVQKRDCLLYTSPSPRD